MKIGINQAQEICNTVRKNFPYDSPWLESKLKNKAFLERLSNYNDIKVSKSKYDELKQIQKTIDEKNKTLGHLRNCYSLYVKNSFEYFRELISLVHKYEIQNCGELARITYAVARMNGVKNSDLDLAMLVKKEKKQTNNTFLPIDKILNFVQELENGDSTKIIDHVATFIKGKRSSEIVVDTLFDECNTRNKLEDIYQNKYRYELGLSKKENLNVINAHCDGNDLPRLKDDEANELKLLFPELIFENEKESSMRKFYLNLYSILSSKNL